MLSFCASLYSSVDRVKKKNPESSLVTALQRLVLPGIAAGNCMCNCLVAVVSTQAITLVVHSKVNTSDCKTRAGTGNAGTCLGYYKVITQVTETIET